MLQGTFDAARVNNRRAKRKPLGISDPEEDIGPLPVPSQRLGDHAAGRVHSHRCADRSGDRGHRHDLLTSATPHVERSVTKAEVELADAPLLGPDNRSLPTRLVQIADKMLDLAGAIDRAEPRRLSSTRHGVEDTDGPPSRCAIVYERSGGDRVP